MAVTMLPDADTFTVLVSFTVPAERRDELVQTIRTFVQEEVRHRSGFVSSTVHTSQDGTRVINYAQWESREAFEAFQSDADAMSRRGVITEFQRDARPYTIAFQATATA
ncbi:putative quinol monooxygenase [Streptomyces capoamus]|uniref:putative quinol monooxygenase n=1 Tax=Streptomyces capoamus TaxID=68183 RepID=UPI003C3005C2